MELTLPKESHLTHLSPEFTIIIVNFNGGDMIQDAVNSLAQQTDRDFELIVVDNASSDGSAERLDLSRLQSATLHRMNENLGFAVANNWAARRASGKWLVLLNPDTIAEPDWLKQLRLASARHSDVRAFASAQISLDDPETMDGAGDAYLVFGFPWRGGFGHALSEMPGEADCFSPCGASAMYDRELFLAHDGFDGRFFCYCEDVDLGYRMQLAGERCVFVPTAVIRHAGSALSGRHSEFSIYHGTRNRLWTYAKNTPWPILLLTLPGHLALTIYILARSPVIGRFGATARGLVDGFKGLGRLRSGTGWRTMQRQTSLWRLVRTMAWNPWKMSTRAPHVRPLGRDELR